MTYCAGATCDRQQAWFAQAAGLPTAAGLIWSYSAADLLARWPSVEWPVPLRGARHDADGEGAFGGAATLGNVRAWLTCALNRSLAALEKATWVPRTRHEGRTGECTLHASPLPAGVPPTVLALPYIVHEPSVVLWWHAHEASLRGPRPSLWVVEDDT